MRKYRAEGWYQIKNLGWSAAVINDERFEKDTGHLIGEQVEIDGHVYTVKAVGCWCIQFIRVGAPIDLLIEGEPKIAGEST